MIDGRAGNTREKASLSLSLSPLIFFDGSRRKSKRTSIKKKGRSEPFGMALKGDNNVVWAERLSRVGWSLQQKERRTSTNRLPNFYKWLLNWFLILKSIISPSLLNAVRCGDAWRGVRRILPRREARWNPADCQQVIIHSLIHPSA